MKKNSLWRSKFVCRVISSAIIIFAFVFVVFCYFSFYYNMGPTVSVVSGRAEWFLPEAEQSPELPFRSDVDRFLQVYFSQPFSDPADKLTFVRLELERFGDYEVDNETDQIIQNVFVADLAQIGSKLEQGDDDLTEENASLAALEKTL